MKLMLQFGKVQVLGLMRSTECSSQGVWEAEVPPTERVDEFPPSDLITCSLLLLADQWDNIK